MREERPEVRLPGDYAVTLERLDDNEVFQVRNLLTNRPTQTMLLPTLTGTVNDLALPADGALFRLQTDGSNRTVTGFAGGFAARVVVIHALGTANISFTHNDGASVAGNRILFPTVLGITLTPPQTATFIYDGEAARWVLTARTS